MGKGREQVSRFPIRFRTLRQSRYGESWGCRAGYYSTTAVRIRVPDRPCPGVDLAWGGEIDSLIKTTSGVVKSRCSDWNIRTGQTVGSHQGGKAGGSVLVETFSGCDLHPCRLAPDPYCCRHRWYCTTWWRGL